MSVKNLEFQCNSCQKLFPKWQGKCDECGGWDIVEKITTPYTKKSVQVADPFTLAEIKKNPNKENWKTGVHELDRVLGEGIAYQSIGLLGGAPGIGKSTFILQILGRLTKIGKKVLYVTGEESDYQIKARAERLSVPQEKIFIQVDNFLENILANIEKIQPDFVVIDSIQTIASEEASGSAGSLTQVRECTMKILQYSKKNPTTFLLVGHITKEGNLAGPKVLEHMVDYVLYLEEENNLGMKTLKAIKNRFGSIYETGLFRMTEKGLAEISQPNQALLFEKENQQTTGTAFYPMQNGNRTILVEVQALVGEDQYPHSLKTALGIDRGKLLLLLAVIEKYLNIKLSQNDVYLNIAGGYRCNDPLISLSIVAAILSSYCNKPLPKSSVFLGEVALTGKLALTSGWKERLKEVERCRFKQAFIGWVHSKNKPTSLNDLQIKSSENIEIFFESLNL